MYIHVYLWQVHIKTHPFQMRFFCFSSRTAKLEATSRMLLRPGQRLRVSESVLLLSMTLFNCVFNRHRFAREKTAETAYLKRFRDSNREIGQIHVIRLRSEQTLSDFKADELAMCPLPIYYWPAKPTQCDSHDFWQIMGFAGLGHTWLYNDYSCNSCSFCWHAKQCEKPYMVDATQLFNRQRGRKRCYEATEDRAGIHIL